MFTCLVGHNVTDENTNGAYFIYWAPEGPFGTAAVGVSGHLSPSKKQEERRTLRREYIQSSLIYLFQEIK